MQVQLILLHWQLQLNQFTFTNEYIQRIKNSLANTLTREFVNKSSIRDKNSPY